MTRVPVSIERPTSGRKIVPADKLILLSQVVKRSFRLLVEEQGHPKGGYRGFLDLSRTKLNLPVRLYCGGMRNGINKIEFIDVARLGLAQTEIIAKAICGGLDQRVRISRIDWAVDILGLSAWDLAASCRVSGTQNSAFYRSRSGVSFYPHQSRKHAIPIYERLRHLRAKHNPLATVFLFDDHLTRFEIQLRGGGVPIRRFIDIRGFADIDLLNRVTFLKFCQPPPGSKPLQILAAERLQSLVQEFGLQNTSKRFSPAEWAYLTKKFFRPASQAEIPDVRSLMRRSIRDWLEDRIRFPRS